MNFKENRLPFKLIFLSLITITLSNCSQDSELFNSVVAEENLEENPEEEQAEDQTEEEAEEEAEEQTEEPQQITSFLNVSDFTLPAQDANGFTILTAQDDSRIIYVDSNRGNDSTGEVYSKSDTELSGNPFTPNMASIQAFATIAEAQKNMREYEADIMLLAAGGVWEESLTVTHGKSENQRCIYASYGQGNRPELRTGVQPGITNLRTSNIIVKGIKFWAHTRDAESSYFTSYDEGRVGFNFNNNNNKGEEVKNVLIEACFFRSYTNNVITNATESGNAPMSKIVLRRNIISRNYSASAHAQGLFYSGPQSADNTSVLLEENIFDHNGWRAQQHMDTYNSKEEGRATIFNHNTYFANAKGVLFYGNFFLRGSSIGNKWTANLGANSASDLALINNIYIDGEIGISIGGNDEGPLRFRNVLISDNVFSNIGRSRPTNRGLAWSIEVKDWDQGEVKNNIFLNQKNTTEISNVYAINLNSETEMKDVTISGNRIYGLNGSNTGARLIQITGAANAASNINISGNYLYDTASFSMIDYDNQSGYTFSENHYNSSESSDSEWFKIDNNAYSLTDWMNAYEGNAETFELTDWQDASRDVDTYLSFIGKGNSVDDLIDLLYNQSEATWDNSLTAPVINQWIRNGFQASN